MNVKVSMNTFIVTLDRKQKICYTYNRLKQELQYSCMPLLDGLVLSKPTEPNKEVNRVSEKEMIL
jgi:hypothetical protein